MAGLLELACADNHPRRCHQDCADTIVAVLRISKARIQLRNLQPRGHPSLYIKKTYRYSSTGISQLGGQGETSPALVVFPGGNYRNIKDKHVNHSHGAGTLPFNDTHGMPQAWEGPRVSSSRRQRGEQDGRRGPCSWSSRNLLGTQRPLPTRTRISVAWGCRTPGAVGRPGSWGVETPHPTPPSR